MKFLIVFLITLSFTASAQVVDNKVHKLVMQFTVGDSTEQASVVAQAANIRAAWPKAQIEIVCHSSGLDLLISNKTKVSKQVAELASQGVVFAACNNTMKRRKLTKEDLLPTAVVVPSAMIELVSKQEEGWAYVKGAH
ncbi:DsrE family protein [soil metagenome]